LVQQQPQQGEEVCCWRWWVKACMAKARRNPIVVAVELSRRASRPGNDDLKFGRTNWFKKRRTNSP
jgi:hypothetical protein